MTTLVPVLLAGGSDTRVWPTSRQSYPKQFVDFTNSGDSLLQSSLKRTQTLLDAAPCIIVTSEEYRFLVAQQARESKTEIGSIILEPVARNTAPAIALAAFEATARHEAPKLLVQTADHYIRNIKAFDDVVRKAIESTAPFILFGVKPSRPETGYGYIEYGSREGSTFSVSSFREKPDLANAESYVAAGNYLWNSGIFMLEATAYLEALQQFEPLIFKACETAFHTVSNDLEFKRVDRIEFSKSPSVSIDYAVMERATNLRVIPYEGDWSDIGAWDAVASFSSRDVHGNAIQGDGLLLDSQNTFVRAESRLVTGIGLQDLIVIETHDAVLVADASKNQHVQELVTELKSQDRLEATEHQKTYRPWGSYKTLVLGDRFQVKQIIVSPGASLSLQMHKHRAEHWVIVTGTAEIQLNNSTHILTENQSIYIPVGSKHRLTNPGKLPLIVIEVQSGDYLGEDDIIRFDDIYGRT